MAYLGLSISVVLRERDRGGERERETLQLYFHQHPAAPVPDLSEQLPRRQREIDRQTNRQTDRQAEKSRRELVKLASWCLKPTQPQSIISGLRETFTKR